MVRNTWIQQGPLSGRSGGSGAINAPSQYCFSWNTSRSSYVPSVCMSDAERRRNQLTAKKLTAEMGSVVCTNMTNHELPHDVTDIRSSAYDAQKLENTELFCLAAEKCNACVYNRILECCEGVEVRLEGKRRCSTSGNQCRCSTEEIQSGPVQSSVCIQKQCIDVRHSKIKSLKPLPSPIEADLKSIPRR